MFHIYHIAEHSKCIRPKCGPELCKKHRTSFPGTDITGDEYDARVTIQYCDALGRVQQTVWRGISPGVYDVVSHVRYNDRGLPEEEWLPTPVNGDQGYYLPFSRVRENAFNYYGDSRPFSQTIYEDNPLNRKIETIGPEAPDVGKTITTARKPPT
ncbi:MAG: DUF6443 domain-containing protein [Barnesiella sp.]